MSDIFQKPLSFEEIKTKSDKYILNTYARFPHAFYFGQGEMLYDTENKTYLDFFSGIAVTSLGHGEADIVEAIREQADRIIHTSNLFYSQEQAVLAETLIGHSFPGKVFFCNSGTEANEAAFKLARSHGRKNKNDAAGILSFENSFHGRSTAGICLTGQKKIHDGFGPLLPEHHYIAMNDLDALEQVMEEKGESLCAFFLEPIQGEGGIHVLDKKFAEAARRLCDENNVLLIMDEIQTGMGRTGKLFAYEHYGIVPDVMTLAKALGNGFPVGAMIVSEKYEDCLTPGMHGSTFGGNHLACRVAFETLKIIMGRELLDHVNALSDFMMQRLAQMKESLKPVKEIRGMGLHIGIELDRPCRQFVEACMQKGLLVNCTAESTVRIMPPLNISLENAAKGLDIFEDCLLSLSEQ